MYYLDFNDIPHSAYSIIYADCPWAYGDKLTGHSFSLDRQYATMGKEGLKNLRVADLCRDDATLFMWVTNPQLPVGLEVMKSWGFKYKTVAFVWTKKTPLGNNVANLGRGTMGSVELCLLGTRGHPLRAMRNIHQLVSTVRGRHSAKPIEVRQRIEQLMGGSEDGKIELFARGSCEGWDQWGDTPEVEVSPV